MADCREKKNTRTKKRYKTVTVKDELRIKRECLQANSFTKNEFPSHDISNEVKTVEEQKAAIHIAELAKVVDQDFNCSLALNECVKDSQRIKEWNTDDEFIHSQAENQNAVPESLATECSRTQLRTEITGTVEDMSSLSACNTGYEHCNEVDPYGSFMSEAVKKMSLQESVSRPAEDNLWEQCLEANKQNFDDLLNINNLDDEFASSTLNEDIFGSRTEDEFKKSENSDYDKPIYDGAQITLGTSIVLIITFSIKYSLSGVAITDLLTLLTLHCAVPNICKQSLRTLKSFFHGLTSPITLHRYCSYCLAYVPDKNCKNCQSTFCNRSLEESGAVSYFISMSITDQISTLFKKPGFVDDIKHRFHRKNYKAENIIADIYDGTQYQKLFPNGPLGDWRNLSFLWNTDGAPVFKSSNFSIWPFYLSINELPYVKRIERDNQILAGLWYGHTKPLMLTFMKPIYEELKVLETKGILIDLDNETEIKTKCFLIAGTCDLPAKCLVCNCTQFNGYYGCTKCLIKGKSVQTGKGGNVTTFPFEQFSETNLRSKESFVADADEALKREKVINGIKGPSWIAGLSSYDIINGTGVDYMHCVLLGVMKTLLKLWFSPTHSKLPFNISRKVSDVDKALQDIKPPNRIARPPRSIEDNLKFFKASELRSFLLFYGPVVLKNFLPSPYYEHFFLLSEAIHILLLKEITETQLQHAQQLLVKFCANMKGLYSDRYELANVHLLLHLVDSVKQLGPLWTHSCFHFEDANGFILKLIHGTQSIQFQIVSAVSMIQGLPFLAQTCLKDASEHVLEFYRHLKHGSITEKGLFELDGKTFKLGGVSVKQLNGQEFSALTNILGFVPTSDKVKAFLRCKVNNAIYHSRMYTRCRVRSSYTVLYKSENHIHVGHIEFFFQHNEKDWNLHCICTDDCHCKISVFNLAMIQPLCILGEEERLIDSSYASSFHVLPVSENHKTVCIPIVDIVDKCVFMKAPNGKYFVSVFPNNCERD